MDINTTTKRISWNFFPGMETNKNEFLSYSGEFPVFRKKNKNSDKERRNNKKGTIPSSYGGFLATDEIYISYRELKQA